MLNGTRCQRIINIDRLVLCQHMIEVNNALHIYYFIGLGLTVEWKVLVVIDTDCVLDTIRSLPRLSLPL